MKTIVNISNEPATIWLGQAKVILNSGESIKVENDFYINLPKGLIEINDEGLKTQKQILFD